MHPIKWIIGTQLLTQPQEDIKGDIVMKKILLSVLTLVLTFSICACGNNQSETKPANDSTTSVNSTDSSQEELVYDSTESFDYLEVEGGIAIIEFKNYDHIKYSKIIIPSEIDNKKVVGIGSLDKVDYIVFGDFSVPCEVVIPSNVSYIGGRAFFGVKNLVKVSGGENCKTLGDFSFADCEDLETVTFYEQLDTISDSAFTGCAKLKQINK